MRANKLRQLFSLLKEGFAEYKWQIFGLAALTLLSGLLEGVGINAIIPFFTFLQKNTQETDSITHFIQSVFTFLHLPFTVKFILIFIATLFIIRMVVLFSSSYLSIKTTTGYEKKTRAELFKLAMSGHWEYILSQKVGHLDQVLITDANRSSGLLLHIGQSFLIVAQFIVYSLLIVNISPIIALVVVLAGGFIFFVFKPLFYRNRIASAESAQMYKDLAHFVDEHIIGIKTVKTSAVEPEVIAAGSGFFNRMEFLSARIAMAHSITNISLQPIGIFFIIAVFAFFYKTSAFSIGSFAVVVYAINKVFACVQIIQGEIHEFSSRAPHLIAVLNCEREARKNREINAGRQSFAFSSALSFANVGFTYQTGQTILSNVSFTLPVGGTLAIVGHSGAGKTTLVDLILRLLEPKSGTVSLDGTDSRLISLESWRKNIGYVAQEVFLLNDTVAANIAFYNPTITTEDIVEAAKMAQIYDFVMTLPDGFKTIVGERGMRLSGGERQRIALARALARKPALLVLDEATSALDGESESLIQKSIEDLKGKITVVAIAHRLSTIMNFDSVVVLEKGAVVETGNPAQLAGNSSTYFYKMVHSNNE